MALGVFVSRLTKYVEEHPVTTQRGAAAAAKITVDADAAVAVDKAIEKIKKGTSLNKLDHAAIETVAGDFIKGARKADGTYDLRAVSNLQKAYAHGILVEFGEGRQAEAATILFKDAVSDAVKRDTAANPFQAAKFDDKVDKHLANRGVATAAAEVRGVEKSALQGQGQRAGQQGASTGPVTNQTEAEKAATVRHAAERAATITDATFGARTNITRGLRSSEQGGFAEKKAAFDLIDQSMEGSGYIRRPRDAAEAAEMAKTAEGRSVEDIRNILLTRPGQGADGKFIDGVITQAEWGKLRLSLRNDLLKSEQMENFSRLDQARISNTKLDSVSTDMKRLREIMQDPAFNPAPVRKADGTIEAGTDRMSMAGRRALETGTPRSSFSDIEADLRGGKPVSPEEIDKLSVHYKRYYSSAAEQKTEAGPQGTFGAILSALGRGANNIFRPLDRFIDRTPLPRLASTVTLVGGTALAGATVVGGTGVGITYFVPDNEVPVLGDLGRRVATNLPFGFAGNVPGASWLPEIYFSKLESDFEYREKILSAQPEEVEKMNSSLKQARQVYIERSNSEAAARGEQQNVQKALQQQTLAQEKVNALAGIGGDGPVIDAVHPEKGISIDKADAIVGDLHQSARAISVDEMSSLAQVIVDKAKQTGSPDVLSKTEYEEVKKDPAYDKLSKDAKQRLDQAMSPNMP